MILYKHTCEKCGYEYLTNQPKIKCGKPFDTPLMQKLHKIHNPDHNIYLLEKLD